MTSLETRVARANESVKSHMLAASVIGLLPLPVIDMVALTGIQLNMLHRLAKLYEMEFAKDRGKALIAALLGGGVPLSLTSSVGSLTKVVPVYGSLVGRISLTVFGAASTYAVGKLFIQHFESGGTLLNFDPQAVRERFAEELEAGKIEAGKNWAGIRP